ncbi:hypothetical protein ACHAQH_004762 [Verticillium albo-atrum]
MLPISSGVSIATTIFKRFAGSPVSLYKRGLDNPSTPQYELPSWSWIVILADLIVFLPLLVIVSYTFQQVFPVLAMVEDENPPAYDPVSLNDDETASFAEDTTSHNGLNKPPGAPAGRAPTVTSSFRATARLIRSTGGFGAFFRGFACLFSYSMATSIFFVIFSAVLPAVLASVAVLLASLALVQLNAAWVHIVMTPRSSAHFWSRLPAFRRTFDATARPVALFWFATQVANLTPPLLAWALDLPLPDMDIKPGEPATVPAYDASAAWKSVIVVLISLAVAVLLVIPAHVVLVRVQASLLPEEDDTIIPFDRSFGGAVVPAVVGGKGYVGTAEAWDTFSISAWRRLVKLYVKIFFVGIAATLLMAAVIVPEMFLIISKSTLKQ